MSYKQLFDQLIYSFLNSLFFCSSSLKSHHLTHTILTKINLWNSRRRVQAANKDLVNIETCAVWSILQKTVKNMKKKILARKNIEKFLSMKVTANIGKSVNFYTLRKVVQLSRAIKDRIIQKCFHHVFNHNLMTHWKINSSKFKCKIIATTKKNQQGLKGWAYAYHLKGQLYINLNCLGETNLAGDLSKTNALCSEMCFVAANICIFVLIKKKGWQKREGCKANYNFVTQGGWGGVW